MEILPSEYQQVELKRSEKLFIRYANKVEEKGLLILKCNPAMIPGLFWHILIVKDGIILFHFLDNIEEKTLIEATLKMIISAIDEACSNIILNKLKNNKSLVDSHNSLKMPVSFVHILDGVSREGFEKKVKSQEFIDYAKKHIIFQNEFNCLRDDFLNVVTKYLNYPQNDVSNELLSIDDKNVNSILQRLAPEYVTVRISDIKEVVGAKGADSELLVVTEDDAAVKAYRLDKEQINIVNKINKGEQLILACAGSGKSVLLIAKCFKAAAMNPDKRFLITCYNNNLYSLYTWFIDKAGLRAKNVECMTLHKLCKELLKKVGYHVGGTDFDSWVDNAVQKYKAGLINDRFYGIFIDEVQQFKTEWYKFCYDLLENKESKDHLFVICGDKTQKLKNAQKHGLAPWNAGEGYPNYRGGNKNIRIEKNYRNCIEVNAFINQYVAFSKNYMDTIKSDLSIDPDMFLRGKAVYHGHGVFLKYLNEKNGAAEAKLILDSINHIHDDLLIPYDEIAVIMHNTKYKASIKGWKEKKYFLEFQLRKLLELEGVDYCVMHSNDDEWADRYGSKGGVKLITNQSVLGLDFRAAIVCGLITLGYHEKTKKVEWNDVKNDQDLYDALLTDTLDNIRSLYVACTRAKEVLHIIIPESSNNSIYVKILEDAYKAYATEN